MSEEKKTIEETIKELKENLELFYQQKNQAALKEFESVLTKLMSMIDILFQYKSSNPDFELDEDKIKNVLSEAMQALQDGDMILLADIMQYDFVEYIETLLKEMD